MLRRVVQLPTPCYLPGLHKRANRIYVDGRISGFTPNGSSKIVVLFIGSFKTHLFILLHISFFYQEVSRYVNDQRELSGLDSQPGNTVNVLHLPVYSI